VPIPKALSTTQIANQKTILGKKLDQAQITAFIPPIVKNLILANDLFVKSGFGPIGKNSFPLYAARFIDPLTDRIRTLPKPSMKYVNPKRLDDVLRYY